MPEDIAELARRYFRKRELEREREGELDLDKATIAEAYADRAGFHPDTMRLPNPRKRHNF